MTHRKILYTLNLQLSMNQDNNDSPIDPMSNSQGAPQDTSAVVPPAPPVSPSLSDQPTQTIPDLMQPPSLADTPSIFNPPPPQPGSEQMASGNMGLPPVEQPAEQPIPPVAQTVLSPFNQDQVSPWPGSPPQQDTSGPIPTFVSPPAGISPLPDLTPISPTGFSSPSSLPPEPPTPEPTESIPTDLSHLVGNSEGEDSNLQTQSPQLETLIVTPAPTPSEAQVISNSGSGFPKWIFIIGGIVLLAVIGASAYFILGIGRPSEQSSPTSETTLLPTITQPAAIMPIETPWPATAGGSFGNLGGSTAGGQIRTPTPSGTSAIDIIRQRQGM